MRCRLAFCGAIKGENLSEESATEGTVCGGRNSVGGNSRLLTHNVGRHPVGRIGGWRGEVLTQGLPGENSGLFGGEGGSYYGT